MSATDALTITSALDALTRYYDAKEREESAVLYINDAYLEALSSLEKLESENSKLRELSGFMLRCMKRNHDCDCCLVNGEHCEISYIESDARELGVEVDG